jgi:DNA-binding transcriptional ArsR family regulator
MSSTFASLHKILKDETRTRIVLLLDQKGNLSYTDLMETLGIVSTGTLNYHLKVLGDLLAKNEVGQYLLTERGKLAARFLTDPKEQENINQEKKKWWVRFWIAAALLQVGILAVILTLHLTGYIDLPMAIRGITGFIFGMLFLYFFYRMIRPHNQNSNLNGGKDRTVKDIFVAGRTMQEVETEVRKWVKEEKIQIETEREGFIRGRLGIPSGLGATAPKYFEVTFSLEQNGVKVHTEGWISLYDVSERNFSNKILTSGNIPRRKGWKVITNLWNRLRTMSKQSS